MVKKTKLASTRVRIFLSPLEISILKKATKTKIISRAIHTLISLELKRQNLAFKTEAGLAF